MYVHKIWLYASGEGGGADAVIEGLPVNAATDIIQSLFVCDIFIHVGLVKVVDEMKVIFKKKSFSKSKYSMRLSLICIICIFLVI